MRIATFNLESLDLPPKASAPIEVRAQLLRPALARLDADVLCLQEVNAQHVPGRSERVLAALDQLVAGTAYAGYHRAATTRSGGKGAADVHNLVTLSRFPVRGSREVRHDLVPPVRHALQTADPAEREPQPICFDRPLLVTEVELSDGQFLSVINLHLRAPLAVSIAGQKVSPFVWRSIVGWAEGYFVSSVRRSAQALELRMLIDQLLTADPQRLIAVAGDFNAEDHETPLRIAVGAEEDTGNGLLSARSLVVLDRYIPDDRRWSVLHHGRPQMLDHILASRTLYGHFRSIEVHNETLGDEAIGYARVSRSIGSYHAAVVAEFSLGRE
ncbi:MAG: endonuclease/exonuclease/phosphatase family protein [Hyphomicrobiaceae bacterium]